MPLLEPFSLGDLDLPNRAVMAPLTRNRAGEGNAPVALNAEYYRQRASAGFIISEGAQVAPKGQGYPHTPGIHSEAQVEGWKKVTEAVHEAGGRLFLQLWHVGRISHTSYHGGEKPVAPSAIRAAGEGFSAGGEEVPFSAPRALDTEEVPAVAEQYRHAAENAKRAGFDGVEIHAANGYLIDQFLRSGTNHRTDRYGGSLEGRTRFLLEVAEAVAGVWGAGRVGVRFSPLGSFNDMRDDDPAETFAFAARALFEAHPALAYLHLVEPEGQKPPVSQEALQGSANGESRNIGGGQDEDAEQRRDVFGRIRAAFDGLLMANGGYDRESAERALSNAGDEGSYAQLVSFGRAFLANPDLPERFRRNAPLNDADPATFYGGGAEGYTDYPTLEEAETAGMAA